MRSFDFDDIEAVEFIDNDEEDFDELEGFIAHYGTPHQGYTPHSGRYAWGSGENKYQRAGGFLVKYNEMKQKGLTETEIAEAFNMNTSELRAKKAKDREAFARGRDNAIYKLADKQWSPKAISQRLGVPQQTVYKVMKRRDKEKVTSLNTTV